MKKRIEYLDLLRVIAILCVICIHINAFVRDYYIVGSKLTYSIFTFIDSIPRIGVPIFFILTGYLVLGKSEEINFKDFLKKTITKLFIPFFIFSIIYYFLQISENNINGSVLDFFTKFTNNGIYYHLWYMYEIIIIYLLIPFAKKLVDRLSQSELKSLIIIIFMVGNLFLSIQMYSARFDNVVLQSFTLPSLIIYYNYVFIGYYLKKYEVKIKKYVYFFGILSIILMPICDYFFINNNMRNDFTLNPLCIFALFPTLAVYKFISEKYCKFKISEKIKKFLCFTSKLSLYIYLDHIFVLNYVVKYINKILIHDRFYSNLLFMVVVFIITTILSIILAKIFDFVYEKILDLFNYKYISNKN